MPGLKELREERFMTTRELARKAHVSNRTINRMEYGIGSPYFSTIKRVADALGVSPGIIEFKPSQSDVAIPNTALEVLRREFEKTIERKILEALEIMNKQTEEYQSLFKGRYHTLSKRLMSNENMLQSLLEAVLVSTPGVRDIFARRFNEKQIEDDCDPIAVVADGGLRLVDRAILEREKSSRKMLK